MNQKNTLEIMAILALIVGLLGGFWGYSVSQKNTNQTECPSEQEIRQDFVEELRKKGAISSVPTSIKQARGEIAEVKEDAVVIETEIPTFDLLQKHLKPSLTAKITEDTELFKLVKEGEASGTYERKKIEKSELERGEQVMIGSKQDFKGKTELEANTIRIFSE